MSLNTVNFEILRLRIKDKKKQRPLVFHCEFNFTHSFRLNIDFILLYFNLNVYNKFQNNFI